MDRTTDAPQISWNTSPHIQVGDADLDIGAEVCTGTGMPEAVFIEEQFHGPTGTHHVGPVSEERIGDKRARQKCLSKRLKIFQKQAQLLHTKCAATVHFSVVTESGRVISGSYPQRQIRHVGLQVGRTGDIQTRRSATGSPRKLPPVLIPSAEEKPKPIQNLPGKKDKSIKCSSKQINKCPVCKIIYNSAKDKEFRHKHRLQAEWLGCEEDGCPFWGHAVCAKIHIPARKSIASIKLHNKHP